MRFVVDGQELIDYLRREGRVRAIRGADAPRPGIILLDLNMPKKDGREALAEIKADRVAATDPGRGPDHLASDEEDVLRTYDLGVNSFITKPVHLRRPGRGDAHLDAVLVRDRRAARRDTVTAHR